MFDQAQLGKRIQERRKAQGFTQEQLGAALGVSAQAVSRWENGESAPDIGLLSAMCQVLGIRADVLLGINAGMGLETLTEQLVQRLTQQKGDAREAALMTVLQRLHFLQIERNVDIRSSPMFYKEEGALLGLRFWQAKGLSFAVFRDALTGTEPDPDLVERLRLLVSPVNWEIVQALLSGPKREQALRESGVCPRPEALHTVLEALMDGGVVVREREGYSLEPRLVLAWAALLRALTVRQDGDTMILENCGGK